MVSVCFENQCFGFANSLEGQAYGLDPHCGSRRSPDTPKERTWVLYPRLGIGIMEKKMETTLLWGHIGVMLRLHRDNGKQNANYYINTLQPVLGGFPKARAPFVSRLSRTPEIFGPPKGFRV